MHNLWARLLYFIVILISNLKTTATKNVPQKESDSNFPGVLISAFHPEYNSQDPNKPLVPAPGPVSKLASEQEGENKNLTSNDDPLPSIRELVPFPWQANGGHVRRNERSISTYLEELKQDPSTFGIHGGNGDKIEGNREFDGPTYGDGQEVLLFRVAASGIPSSDPFGGKSDPFLQISYSNGSLKKNDFVHLARTKTLMDTNEPRWEEVVQFEQYVRGAGQQLQFELRDNDAHDWDDQIGYAWVDVDQCVLESRQKFSQKIGHREESFSACSAQITNENGELVMLIV